MRVFDFPFSARHSFAVLPWVIAFMVFLTVLFASIALNVDRLLDRWQGAHGSRISLHIPSKIENPMQIALKLEGAIRKMNGVENVERIAGSDLREMLSPWLGKGDGLKSLPMPILMDVTLDEQRSALPDIQRLLAADYPMVVLDDYAIWLDEFRNLIRSAGLISTAIVILIAMVTAVIVVMSTRTELALHRSTLLLLRSLGATSGYIARQFNLKALWTSLQGTVIGSTLALGVLLLFQQLSSEVKAPLLPLLTISSAHLLVLLLVMLGAIGVAVLSAQWTVMRQLKF